MVPNEPVLYATPIRVLLEEAPFPTDFVTGEGGLLAPLLDALYFTDYSANVTHDSFGAILDLVVLDEAAVELPGLDGFQIVLGGDASGLTRVSASFQVSARGVVTSLSNVKAALRFPPDILKPVSPEPGIAPPQHAQIEVRGAFLMDESFDLQVEGFDALRLAPAMIGDSGIVIEADDVKLDLSRTGSLPEVTDAGFDDSFLGVFIGEARVRLPKGLPDLAPEDLVLHDCAIGSGGVSGRLAAEYDDPSFDPGTRTYQGRGAGDFFGVPFALTRVAVEVKQNAFLESSLEGQLLLPFFDKRVNVIIGLNLDGGFSAEIAGAPELGDAYDEVAGLLTLEKPGIFKLAVQSLRFEVLDGVLWTRLSGELTPLVGDVSWPTLQVTELAIDSRGRVSADGGWLNLPSHPSFKFHGFQMEVTKLGFGNTDDGGRWVGLSGGIRLVRGFTAGASVEGLRIHWYADGQTRVTFDGVGVEFQVPQVIQFKGSVSFHEPEGPAGTGGFAGALQVALPAIDLQISGALRVGTHADGTYFAIYLAAELPAGIPLWATGLAVYGFAGLFGKDVEPDRLEDEEWYDGWYKRPAVGVTDLNAKWRPASDSIGLGAGATIGTLADNGHAFSARVLLAIVFPGPIILVEGRANLLKERSKLAGDEPIFRALGVIDGRSDTITLGLDAHYKYDDTGKLLDISGGAEAFFDRRNAANWHVYLGQDEPRTKRISAEVFRLFTAESYLMLDQRSFRTGLWVGIDEEWTFTPFKLEVEAFIEASASVNAKPSQYHGKLWLHGKIGVSVWRFGVDLEVDADLEADVFTPYHVLGVLRVHIGLPWPLSDIDRDVNLEWGPDPVVPALPLPLQSVSVEHFKVTTTWPLARGTLLRPTYGTDGFRADPDVAPAVVESAATPDGAPVVPLDCRPRLTFGRTVHDDAMVGINPQPPQPEFERIGDPEQDEGPLRVRFGLREVALHARDGTGWRLVARKVAADHPQQNPPDLPELFGSWAPAQAIAAGADETPLTSTKLWLWSKTPFDFIRHGGGQYADWFIDEHDDYPCVSPPADRTVCVDFEDISLAAQFLSPWIRPMSPRLQITWIAPGPQHVVLLDAPVDGVSKALLIPPRMSTTTIAPLPTNHVRIGLPSPAKEVTVTVLAELGVHAIARQEDGGAAGPVSGGSVADPHLTLTGDRLVLVELVSRGPLRIARICFVRGAGPQELEDIGHMNDHVNEALSRWSEAGNILAPDTQYRLKCVSTIDAEGEGELAGMPPVHHEQVEYAYFQTAGPPGLGALSIPDGEPEPDAFRSGLDTLAPYVRQTLPVTVPAPGENPDSPVRPVYRAYDVAVRFNEDYVDLMYRAHECDLGLYLFDNNGEPVREFRGLLLEPRNVWLPDGPSTLELPETMWADLIDASTCADLDASTRPPTSTLYGAAAGRVLEADTVYEGRLTPLLFREEFRSFEVGDQAGGPAGTLGAWRIVDSGTQQGPSRWSIEEGDAGRRVVQSSNIWGANTLGRDPVKPGTVLLRGDNTWTDYELHVRLESADDDAIGVVFRYLDDGTFYRFSIDRQRSYRRLVRVVSGITTILAEDDFRYERGHTYAISVAALGEQLRVRQDGITIFEAVDATIDRGAIGLYCWGNEGANFHSIRVEDLRPDAPVVYRFSFTTSRFANFFHHQHSFQDESSVRSLAEADFATTDFSADDAPTEEEAREYERLAEKLGGDGPLPRSVEVVAVAPENGAEVLWVRQPEPLLWPRIHLDLGATARWSVRPRPPDVLKLTAFQPGEMTAGGEKIELLSRDVFYPTGYRVEERCFPGPVKADHAAFPWLEDEFERQSRGVVFMEQWGPNALDKYKIVDEGTQLGPSQWSVAGEEIHQSSLIFGGTVSAEEPAKPGTVALLDRDWGNVRLTARLRVESPGAVGLVFRHSAPDRYYRFSVDPELGYRRLIKKGAGGVVTLYEDDGAVVSGETFEVIVEVFDDWLLGFVDRGLVFAVRDGEHRSGGVGIYAWRCSGARFADLTVETMDSNPVALLRGFTHLGELRIVDAPDAVEEPSEWVVEGPGVLAQRSSLFEEDGEPLLAGTFALISGHTFGDVDVSVRMRSEAHGILGALFRYQNEDNYYRFSMRRDPPFRRLTRVAGSVPTTLWEDAVAYEPGRSYELTLHLNGPGIAGRLDGAPLFSVTDAAFLSGQVGLYCWGNSGARFERVVVLDRQHDAGRWTVIDAGDLDAPSAWRADDGVFRQTSSIFAAGLPAALGTHALAGDREWTDYRLRVDLRSDAGGAIGAVFRYTGEDDYYRFSMDSNRGYRRLVKSAGGSITTLWEDSVSYTIGQFIEMVVDLTGSRVVVHVDGEKLADVHDGSHVRGQVGLYTSEDPGAQFARVVVAPLPRSARALFRDRFDEGTLADWTVTDTGDVAAPSAWQTDRGVVRQTSNVHDLPIDRDTLGKRGTQLVAGGLSFEDFVLTCRVQSFDNDAIGVSFRYQDADNHYRFSMDSQRAYRRLVKVVNGQTTLLWESGGGYTVGRAHRLAVVAAGTELRVYLDGIPVCAVSDADLGHGTVALYCWGNDDARYSHVRVLDVEERHVQWTLDEPFEDLIPDRWDFTPAPAAEAAARWQVAGGTLQHGPGAPGIDLAIPRLLAAHDTRISARLEKDGSGSAGILVRHRDADNHYALLAGDVDVRLLRRTNGEDVELWRADLPPPDRAFFLTFDCRGRRLTGFLDGQRLFDLDDAVHETGGVGLRCDGELSVTVHEVRVSEPAWRPHFVFGREPPLPAGTPIELCSGNATDATQGTAGATRRFVAVAPDPGDVHMDERPHLRVVDGLGQTEHEREHLPASDFSNVDARVIRNRDGTRCFVVPTAGASDRQQYQLGMTFRRDNRAVDPESPVLRQAGDSGDEHVVMSIPPPDRET